MGTPNYNFPELTVGQGSKELTHNEALRIIDALLSGAIDKDLTTPPVTASEGDTYIIPSGATGAWSGNTTDSLTIYLNSVWQFFTPSIRWGAIWVKDKQRFYRWDGSEWAVVSFTDPDVMLKSIYDPDGNEIVDFALSSDNAMNLEGNPASYYLDYQNLLNKPSLFSGNWADLVGRPTDIMLLNTPQVYTRAKVFSRTTLVDQPLISWDLDLNQCAIVTLSGNRTVSAPTNQRAGGTYTLFVAQDTVGNRTLTWNTVFKWAGGSVPSLSTGANKIDIFTFVSDGTNMYGTAIRNF